jgi:frataxin
LNIFSAFAKLNFSLTPLKSTVTFSNPRHQLERRFASTQTPDSPTPEVDYETVSEETLESLSEHFEELFENDPRMAKADVALASGVLNVIIPKHGTFVINKQTPNRQIWLSSPVSGPYRFDLVRPYDDVCAFLFGSFVVMLVLF